MNLNTWSSLLQIINGLLFVDVDECITGSVTCPRFRKCVNTFGSYICKCHKGFDLMYIGGRYQCHGNENHKRKPFTNICCTKVNFAHLKVWKRSRIALLSLSSTAMCNREALKGFDTCICLNIVIIFCIIRDISSTKIRKPCLAKCIFHISGTVEFWVYVLWVSTIASFLNYPSELTFIYARTKLRTVGGNFLIFCKIHDSHLGYRRLKLIITIYWLYGLFLPRSDRPELWRKWRGT